MAVTGKNNYVVLYRHGHACPLPLYFTTLNVKWRIINQKTDLIKFQCILDKCQAEEVIVRNGALVILSANRTYSSPK